MFFLFFGLIVGWQLALDGDDGDVIEVADAGDVVDAVDGVDVGGD